MTFNVTGTRRQKWVGPPVPAPKGDRCPPSVRQRHYRSTELAGTGERIHVDDVVEVVTEEPPSSSTSQPRLAQVESMWEDTLTAASKFRARWLVRACDLPRDALQRLLQSRGVSPPSKPSAARVGDGQTDAKAHLNEVFLTSRAQDLELRMIRKAAVVSVKANEDISPSKGQGHIVPRLTHTFCPSTGDFSELSDGEGVLVRARSRQADAAAASAIASLQGRGALKCGSSADGWLLQKGRSLATRGRGRGRGRGGGRGGFDGRTSSTTFSGDRSQAAGASSHAQEVSEKSETGADPMDEAWEEGDDGISDSDSDAGFASSYRSALPPPSASAEKKTDPKVASKPRKPQRSSGSGTVQNELTMSSTGEDVDSSQTSPTNGPQMPRRPRAPAIRRQGPLPPRPRRLAVPPAVVQTPPKGFGNGCPVNRASTLCDSQAASPMRTRFGTVGKDKPSPTRSSAQGKEAENEPLTHMTGKRKRAATPAADEAVSSESFGYPPRRTPVGDEYQADIPDLLPPEKRRPLLPKEDGAQMVWRSARDWDPRARASLDEYVRAVKKILEVKQARVGVGVHVRFRGTSNSTSGDENEEKNVPSDNTGSHAMWAVTTGRNAVGDIRVGCSDRTQTEIPRSAIQRVSCEEEALTGLVKARCLLNNFTPALQMFIKDQDTPESIQPWTFTQVRALEKSLEREFDPERHVLDLGKPGVKMDREDFIDLAKVSKSVPGKEPREVLAFYYKYLCAADPLTGTGAPYGKEASATQRKGLLLNKEPSRSLSDSSPSDGAKADKTVSPPSRGQASPQASGTRTPPPGSNATPATPDTEDKITHSPVNVPSPDASEGRRMVNDDSTTTGASAPEKPSIPEYGVTVVKNSSPSQDARRDEHKARLSSDQPRENRDVSPMLFANNEDELRRSPTSVRREKDEEARNKASSREIERSFTRPKLMPPGTEVLEVLDDESDDEKGLGRGDLRREGRRRSNPLPHQASPPLDWRSSNTRDGWSGGRPSGGTVENVLVSRHPTSATAPVHPRSVRTPVEHTRQSAFLNHPRPAHVLPTTPYMCGDERLKERYFRHREPGGSHGDEQYQRDLSRREEHVGTSSVEGWATRTRSDPRYRVEDDVRNGSRLGGGDSAQLGAVRVSYDPATVEAKFGLLAPCWRLLEKARAYLEENQLRYMSGLIQAHLKKPMTRDQLLERAKSCLEEQVLIFNAFVKMFDRIEKPLAVPFYPSAKRTNGSTPPAASPSLSRHGAVLLPNGATQRKQEGTLPAFNTSPSLPARGRATSGVGFRLSHPPPDCGTLDVDRGVSRTFRRSIEAEERAPSVSAHEQSGTSHPRSTIPHARIASGSEWCSSSGVRRTESPVYRSRSPTQHPVVSYVGGGNPSAGKLSSGFVFSAKHGAPCSGESRYAISVPRTESHRASRGPTVRKDGGNSEVRSSSVSDVMAGEAGNATGPCKIGALRTLPGLRHEPERELRWRSTIVQEPRSSAVMTTAAEVPVEGKGFSSGRAHWGFRNGLNSWR